MRLPVRWLVPFPGEAARENVTLTIHHGRIAAIEPLAQEAPRALLACPALFNAHDHGRAISSASFGAIDGPLELWLPELFKAPRFANGTLPGEAICALRILARGGAAGVVILPGVRDETRLNAVAEAWGTAAETVGLRVTLVLPLGDRWALGPGEDDEILADIPDPAERARIRALLGRPQIPWQAQIAAAERIIARFADWPLDFQLGPIGPHWCSAELLREAAAAATANGWPMHMHFLESRRQRAWADRCFPDAGGVIGWLARTGLLGPRLTLAHGVWLREAEIVQLATAGVRVAVNTGSNLRLMSGLAPVPLFEKHGLVWGIGTDSLSIDDDGDLIRDTRVTGLLHQGSDLLPVVDRHRAWAAAISGGRAIAGAEGDGRLCVGAPADLLLFGDSLAGGGAATAPDELLLSRASARHLTGLIAGGRWVDLDAVDDLPVGSPPPADITEQAALHRARLAHLFQTGRL